MMKLKIRLLSVLGMFAVMAWAVPANVPFVLPPSARVTVTNAAGKGWMTSGEIRLSFQQAQHGLATRITAAGWCHLHTIGLGKDRVLDAWSRGDEELTVMVWRLAPGRSGFSYGLSKKATAGKGSR